MEVRERHGLIGIPGVSGLHERAAVQPRADSGREVVQAVVGSGANEPETRPVELSAGEAAELQEAAQAEEVVVGDVRAEARSGRAAGEEGLPPAAERIVPVRRELGVLV